MKPMNKYLMLVTFHLIIFTFFACKEKKEGLFIKFYMEDALYYKEKANFEYALNYFRLIKENSLEADSVPYWMKAIIGEGEILLLKKDYKGARKDFEELISFARRRKLVEEECLGWYRLGQIASSMHEPIVADSCYRKAVKLAVGLKNETFPHLEEEATIAEANVHVLKEATLSDSIYQRLVRIQKSDSEELKVAALKLLVLNAVKSSPGAKNWLSLYVQVKEKLSDHQLREYAELQEQEKAQLVLQRDRETRARQLTLFISLGTFAFLICAGIYIMINYRRRHELDRIQRILAQKELDIYRLEQKSDELNKVRNLLHESEKAVTELECRNKELDKVRLLLKDKEEQFGELEERFKEVNQMREQIRRKEKELKDIEERFLAEHFYRSSKLAALIPSPNNPNKPKEKDFEGIFGNKNEDQFLQDYNNYYNNFASRLNDLNPKLTKEDLVYCCLFRMNVRPSDIALMFSVSRNTVSMRRKRIEVKMEEK